jgi:hypothetical protein
MTSSYILGQSSELAVRVTEHTMIDCAQHNRALGTLGSAGAPVTQRARCQRTQTSDNSKRNRATLSAASQGYHIT